MARLEIFHSTFCICGFSRGVHEYQQPPIQVTYRTNMCDEFNPKMHFNLLGVEYG